MPADLSPKLRSSKNPPRTISVEEACALWKHASDEDRRTASCIIDGTMSITPIDAHNFAVDGEDRGHWSRVSLLLDAAPAVLASTRSR